MGRQIRNRSVSDRIQPQLDFILLARFRQVDSMTGRYPTRRGSVFVDPLENTASGYKAISFAIGR